MFKIFHSMCFTIFVAIIMVKGKQNRVLLPLLEVLKSVKPDQRVIILAHLDDQTRDLLYKTIYKVINSDKIPFAKRRFLNSKLTPFKNELRDLGDANKTLFQKKKRLIQVGGGPMSYVLRAAIPLILDTFPK